MLVLEFSVLSSPVCFAVPEGFRTISRELADDNFQLSRLVAEPVLSLVPLNLRKVVQEFRRRVDAGHQQMIPRPRTGDVEKMALRVVDLLQVGIGRFPPGDDEPEILPSSRP
jgi:hypothetical protein